MSGTLERGYFEDLYARDPDPWGFRVRPYERDKYAETVAALEGRRFTHAVEVGCSIGELTFSLAPQCGTLLGVDIADAPLALARERNRDRPGVSFARMSLPEEAPSGPFDLIVFSEVLYYFGEEDLARVADWACGALAPGGVVLLVHWLGETPDYPQGGDEAVVAFLSRTRGRLTTDLQRRRALYRLDRLHRSPPGDAPPA